MASSTPETSFVERITPRWWWVWILTGLLLGGGVGGLLAGLPQLARAEIGARLEAIAERTGFRFDIEKLHVDLFGRVELSGVRATAPSGVGVVVSAESIGTRLRVESLLRGEKRLGDVRVDGLVATLDALPERTRDLPAEVERRLRALRQALRAPVRREVDAGPATDLRIVVLGARVEVAGGSAPRVLADDLSLTVARSAKGGVSLEGSGRLAALGGAGFSARAALGAQPVAEASFEPPLVVEGASLQGVRLDAEGTVTVLGLSAGPLFALGLQVEGRAAEVVLRRGGQGPGGLSGVEARGVEANVWLPEDLGALVETMKKRLTGGGGSGSGGGGDSLADLVRKLSVPLRIEGVAHLHRQGVEAPVVELTGLEATATLSRETRLEAKATLSDGDGLVVPVRGRVDAVGLAPTRLEVGVEGAPLGRLLRERLGTSVFSGRGTADATVRWERTAAAPLLAGEVTLHELTIDDRRISRDPVVLDGVALAMKLDRTRDGAGATVAVAVEAPQGGHATLTVAAKGLDGDPVYTVELDVPKQQCAGLVRSVPKGMLPTLHGQVKVEGTLHGKLRIENLDPKDIPHLRFVTEGSWDDCRIRTMGDEVDRQLARIKGRFKQEVDEGEGPIGVMVGSAMGSYLPLSRIPPLLQAGPLLTEDGGFYDHKGFSESRLEGALRLDLQHGRYVYGGSTLSQQLVKNLFLHRDKTLARKLEEALIVVAMERTLTKQRILELYLNCIEYGMKLYGIANAARHYFGKTVDQLTPLEIAFLMHLKTTPKEAWYLHKRGALPQRWRDALAYRMRNFKRKGWITDEQYDAAAPFDPIAHPEPTATAPEVPM